MHTMKPRATDRTSTPDEMRCGCGRLIARRTARGIELVCTRCEEILILDLDTDPPRLVPSIHKQVR